MGLKKIKENWYRIVCDYCGRAITSVIKIPYSHEFFRGSASCPECLQFVDDDIANSYIKQIAEIGIQNSQREFQDQHDKEIAKRLS